jgi:hypothetical protein
MSTSSFNSFARLAAGRSIVRRVTGPLAGLMLVALALVPSPLQAQVQTEALVQLEMLDTTPDDLMRLATTYADALRDWKSAKLSIDTVQTLRPSAVVTNLEVQIARVNLEASEAKLRVLRAIVEKQLAAAENKVAILRKLEEGLNRTANGEPAGATREQNYVLANDQATVDILKMILAMR